MGFAFPGPYFLLGSVTLSIPMVLMGWESLGFMAPSPNLSLPQKKVGSLEGTLVFHPPTTVIGQRQDQEQIQILPLVYIYMLEHRSYFFY